MTILEFFDTELGKHFFEAQRQCSLRPNISSISVLNTGAGNGNDPFKCIAGALLTVGDAHAPLLDCYRLYSITLGDIHTTRFKNILVNGGKIPGLGTSFCKGRPDPIWDKVDSMLPDNSYTVGNAYRILGLAQEMLTAIGKDLYPNAAFYTTCVGLLLGLHITEVSQLFIIPRLQTWCNIMKGEIPWETS